MLYYNIIVQEHDLAQIWKQLRAHENQIPKQIYHIFTTNIVQSMMTEEFSKITSGR